MHCSSVTNLRLRYIAVLLFIIAVGLLSRRIDAIPASTGDLCWAMMIFCLLRMMLPQKRLTLISFVTIVVSFSVEFGQLIQWEWLCRFRNTFIGHMMLGQGFLVSDLAAYTIGVAVITLAATVIEPVHPNKRP